MEDTQKLKYKAKLIGEKMMLVSSDIQVGDKVTSWFHSHENGDSYITSIVEEASKVYEDFANYKLKHGELKFSSLGKFIFKVIGEISPEATWVTENQEFDENEIKLTTPFKYKEGWEIIYRQGKDRLTDKIQQVRPYSPSFGINRWEILDLQPEDCIYQIKGPCGHFH